MSDVFQWLHFKIDSAEVRVREFTDKNGVERCYREQPAVVFCCVKDSDEVKPREILVPLEGDAAPYPPGDYTLSRRSYYVDFKRFGRLSVIPRLVPVPSRYVLMFDDMVAVDGKPSGGIRL